jgi:23S rRNA A1618 N6-methylase RlmF
MCVPATHTHVAPNPTPQTPGNANYLAKLAELVVQAEMDVLLSVNFAIDIRYNSPSAVCCAVLCAVTVLCWAWARQQRCTVPVRSAQTVCRQGRGLQRPLRVNSSPEACAAVGSTSVSTLLGQR